MDSTTKKPNGAIRKGYRAEAEIVKKAIEAGLDAERARKSDGRDLGCARDVDAVIADLTVQVKRRKQMAHYLLPSGSADVQAVRQDHGEWMFVVPGDLFLRLLAERGIGLDPLAMQDEPFIVHKWSTKPKQEVEDETDEK